MVNKLIALIIVSVIIVFFPYYASEAMSWILVCHGKIMVFLSKVFSDGQVGRIIRDLLGLLIFPLLTGLLPVILYWIVKRRHFPYFMSIVWSLWLLQLGALIVLHRM